MARWLSLRMEVVMSGRPLEYRPRPGASGEVNQLREALIELIIKAQISGMGCAPGVKGLGLR